MLKIYLDNCCYNRPYDEQIQDLIRLETEAKLIVQDRIKRGWYSLVWSYILESENDENPSGDKHEAIQAWKYIASEYCPASDEIISKAKDFATFGLKHKDAIHLACAMKHKCDYLLTMDKKFLNKSKHFLEISIMNPIAFLLETEDKNANR